MYQISKPGSHSTIQQSHRIEQQHAYKQIIFRRPFQLNLDSLMCASFDSGDTASLVIDESETEPFNVRVSRSHFSRSSESIKLLGAKSGAIASTAYSFTDNCAASFVATFAIWKANFVIIIKPCREESDCGLHTSLIGLTTSVPPTWVTGGQMPTVFALSTFQAVCFSVLSLSLWPKIGQCEKRCRKSPVL